MSSTVVIVTAAGGYRGKVCGTRLLVVLGSTLLSLASVELGTRAWTGRPLLSSRNWRSERLERARTASPAVADARLGWTMRPWVAGPGFNTLDFGIRSNGLEEAGVRMGGVLAVGDSFTAGSEVADGESWPAQLEGVLGEPVINAGVGGYGTDQIVLRAEQLLPIVRPHTLIVGFLEDDIARSGYSVYGRPKPYYTLENGALVEHPPGEPRVAGLRSTWDWARRHAIAGLGYSAAADRILERLAPQFWDVTPGEGYVRTDVDSTAITCSLLVRLRAQMQPSRVRGLLFMQYGGRIYASSPTPSTTASRVLQCAAAAGFEVVDEFPSLSEVYRRDRAELSTYYVMHPGDVYGHMSARGNGHAAALLAAAIGRTATASHQRSDVQLVPRATPPTYLDLISAMSSTTHAVLALVTSARNRADTVYSIGAVGEAGEHYVAASGLASPPGRHMLTAELKGAAADRVRVQLLDGRGAAAIVDVDLSTGGVTTLFGPALLEPIVNTTRQLEGWIRIGISAELPGPGRTVILQLLSSSGSTSFDAANENVYVRTLRLGPDI